MQLSRPGEGEGNILRLEMAPTAPPRRPRPLARVEARVTAPGWYSFAAYGPEDAERALRWAPPDAQVIRLRDGGLVLVSPLGASP